MLNKYTGDVGLDIGGIKYTLRYDYEALSLLKTKYSDSELDIITSGGDIKNLSDVLVAGIKSSDITAEEIHSISPPLAPTLKSLNEALAYAYYGIDGAPDLEEGTKKKPITKKIPALLFKHILIVSFWVSVLVYFGLLHLGNIPSW